MLCCVAGRWLAGYSQVDILGMRYTSVNFGGYAVHIRQLWSGNEPGLWLGRMASETLDAEELGTLLFFITLTPRVE